MTRNVFISIVSHAQEKMIIKNFNNFPKSCNFFNIKLSIMDNTGSKILKKFCQENELFYYHDGKSRGFGANHNKMFSLISPQNNDIFIICNPDIRIINNQLYGLLHNFVSLDFDLGNVKIYFNKEDGEVDNPDKYFPGFFNFAFSLATDKRLHYGSNMNVQSPEWISGAFMIFKQRTYRKLNGFDESYFMYCEDIDLCFRAKKLGIKPRYDVNHYIEHDAQMDSRGLFSPSMKWHINSAVKFIVKNRFFYPLIVAK